MKRYELQPDWMRHQDRDLHTPMIINYNHGLSYGRYNPNSQFHVEHMGKAARELDLAIRYLRLLEKHGHVKILACWNKRMEAGAVCYMNLTKQGAQATDNLERGCKMRWNDTRTKLVRKFYTSLGRGSYSIDDHFAVIHNFNEAALEMDIAAHNEHTREWMYKKYKALNPATRIPEPHTFPGSWSGRLTNKFVHHTN